MPVLMLKGGPDQWGLILNFLSDDDPRGVKEQFNSRYIDGWNSFEGFTLDEVTFELSYPGDPPHQPKGIVMFRNELIILYPFDWVLVREPTGEWEVSRMD